MRIYLKNSHTIQWKLIISFLFAFCIQVAAQEEDDSIDSVTISSDSLVRKGDSLAMATDYQWISYRGKMQITKDGQTRDLSFFFVNKIDSIMYIAFHVSGIELLRTVMTPDTITLVDKMGNRYYKGNYNYPSSLVGMPIDFKVIQALFNGWQDKLESLKTVKIKYDKYQPIADNSSIFFHRFVMEEENEEIKIEMNMKNVKLNLPGPTEIRIPEKFTEIKRR
ncbi:MAG: DUF4292 domain-containing protein [Bacteroidales bacterium]